MNKRNLWIFRITTILFSLLMLFSAFMYFTDYELVSTTFTNLNFPTYIIYPLAIAKILGVLAIWVSKSETLRTFAYAGFFYNILLAISGHVNLDDGEFGAAMVALLLLAGSFLTRHARGASKTAKA